MILLLEHSFPSIDIVIHIKYMGKISTEHYIIYIWHIMRSMRKQNTITLFGAGILGLLAVGMLYTPVLEQHIAINQYQFS